MIIKIQEDKNTRGGLKTVLRALRHRNYRLFFIGQGFSLIGTWMQSVAVSWLVFRLTHSAFMLGLVGFSGQISAFLLSPFAGVLSDRLNRRRILIISQVLAMLQALTLALVTVTGYADVAIIVSLSFLLGLINGFDMPTRQAFVVEMINDKADLGNAIALNSSLFNASRLIGPSIAGVLIAYTGEGTCFLINSISFLPTIYALLSMEMTNSKISPKKVDLLSELKDGFAYAYNFIPIRSLLAHVSLMSIVGMSFPVLLPIFATQILKGDSHTFGFLVSATGMGAIAGTIFLASRKSVLGLDKIIIFSTFVFSAGLIGFSFSSVSAVSFVLLVVAGFGMIINIAACNTILQTIVDENMRGRVMSFYTMSFMGAAPLGSIIAGSMSSGIGAPATVLIGGFISAVGGIFFARKAPLLRKMIKPIYTRLGIIPEIALGIQTADELSKGEGLSGN
ncbi:MAG: MFS transporter [Spirochaetes bacterium]|nr:MFS transporter [Spirochaetota bacterium]